MRQEKRMFNIVLGPRV